MTAYHFTVCSCGHGVLHPAGQSAYHCPFCGRRWQHNPHSKPVQYSGRPDPRFTRRDYPGGSQLQRTTRVNSAPNPPRPYAPNTPAAGISPAVWNQAADAPQPLPSAPVKKPSTSSSFLWIILAAVAVIFTFIFLTNPDAIVNLINPGSSGASSNCQAFSYIGTCTASSGTETRSGYKWCYARYSSGDEGHGWVPNACIR